MNIPTLKTNRLILTPLGENSRDAEDIQRNINDPDIAKFLTIPWPYPEGGAQKLIEDRQKKIESGEAFIWAVRLAESPDECIGSIGYRKLDKPDTYDRGFWLASRFHRQGLMSEAVKETMRYMFEEKNMQRLEVSEMNDNIASSKIKERLGFRPMGTKTTRDCPFRNHEPTQLNCWMMTKEDWLANQSPDIS